MAAFSFFHPSKGALRGFINRMSRSRFFTISVALHFILVLTFGGVVLVKQATQKTDVMDAGGDLVASAPPPTSEPVQPMEQPSDVTPTTVSAPASALSPITTLAPSNNAFSLPASMPSDVPTTGRTLSAETSSTAVKAPTFSGMSAKAASDMKKFVGAWTPKGSEGSGVGKDRVFKFTAFMARYSGGDWGSTIEMRDGKISKGSLPNLLYVIRKQSRDKIDAEPDALPLDLESDDLFTKKPPFVLFTGHRDFVLTDKEIENLQKYLQLGGCVWGDSSLPGKNSRFDLAFRREMKRVLPDQNIAWEALPPDHPIYTKTYWPEIRAVPPGLNYYQEPVYALKNFGEIVVLYTANDYGDMWQIGLDEKWQYDLRRDENLRFVAMNEQIYEKRNVYFRDLDLKAVEDSYKFGTNIIVHLLTRWEDKLRNVPDGL